MGSYLAECRNYFGCLFNFKPLYLTMFENVIFTHKHKMFPSKVEFKKLKRHCN